ncbi:MAG: alpha/beta hydrolase [Candidatus Omnitrophica bacterium]|nr:alpha/beta hydrolase [Candidatus Omnitrophota bacterium]
MFVRRHEEFIKKFIMAQLKTNRGLIWHYDIAGSGEPVLFIHGFGASGHWWSAQKESLARAYQVITVDLPGHGESDWMPVGLNEMAVDIRQILNAIGAAYISVAASSFGGLVALELYRMMAGHIMRMSFVGAIPKFARGPNYPAGLDIDKIRKLSGQFNGDYTAVLDIFFRSLFTMKEREGPRSQWVKQLRAGDPVPRREALKAFLDILEKADLRDRLSSVICPLQFITGSGDYICPREIMDWVAGHAYNARFDFIDECGHLPFLTEVEEYNRLLEDFLIS